MNSTEQACAAPDLGIDVHAAWRASRTGAVPNRIEGRPAPKPVGAYHPEIALIRVPGCAARAALLAAGIAVLSSLTSGAMAQAPVQGQAQPEARHAHINLQSLHPIVGEVLPAVVNVAVVLQAPPATEQEQFISPGQGEGAPNFPKTPFDEFLRRFFDSGPGIPAPMQETPQAPMARPMALGSGFIIDPAGYVVTNNHVVDNADKVTVIFQDGSKHPAKVIGRDAKTDLALLKIDAKEPLPYVSWGDSNAAQVGDWVLAVGNPFGLGGTVSCRHRLGARPRHPFRPL